MSMRASMYKANVLAKAYLNMPMETVTPGISLKVQRMDKEHLNGIRAMFMWDCGAMTCKMVMES